MGVGLESSWLLAQRGVLERLREELVEDARARLKTPQSPCEKACVT